MSTSASDPTSAAGGASIAGDWYDGVSSQREEARVDIAADGTATLVVGSRTVTAMPVRELAVSERVGNIPRAIAFGAAAGRFQTRDNDLVDRVLAAFGHARARSRVHVLESRWTAVLAGLVVIAVAVRWFVVIGLPVVASRVAFALPPQAAQALTHGALDVLDRTIFNPSTLAQERQDQIGLLFDDVVAQAHSGEQFRLRFRASPVVGANAFALPSGDVVLTDELVALAERDEEIAAVLAHEAGHVVHRHALREVLQNSTVALLVLAVTGDAGMVSSFVTALPTYLAQLTYSRDFEREADRHALDYLHAKGFAPANFTNVLDRLVASHGDADEGPGFLRTHPSTDERRVMFRND